MISFRYHVVSIVAVFLALAVGIVVGTTALNGPITKSLRHQVTSARDQRDTLDTRNQALQGQLGDARKFATTYGPQVVADTLRGRSVLLIDLPGATGSMRSGAADQIANAGGKVTGTLTVTDQYLTSSSGDAIVSLATDSNSKPIGLTLPETSDPGQLGGALLSYVLTGQGAASDLTQVVAGLTQLHMVQATKSLAPATDVMLVGGSVPSGNEYATSAELALVESLASRHAHVVVAGDPAAASGGGLVASVRHSTTARPDTATVDDADTSFGQVSAVLAMAAALKGQVGQYGTQQGADALFPAPAS